MTAPVPLATVADVQARTDEQLTDHQKARAGVLLGDATAMAYAQVPSIPNPPPPTAVGVICTAVLRALATPADGMSSETIGGYTRTPAKPGGGLYLTDEERDLLRAPPPSPRGAFSIRT